MPAWNLIVTITVVVLFNSIATIHSETLERSCRRAIQFSSSTAAGRNCSAGFISNATCCERTFGGYLFAAGHRANTTGKIFMNPTEQRDCLAAMGTVSDDVVEDCRIDRLTSGGDRPCSNDTVGDVENNLGREVTRLGESCRDLGTVVSRDQCTTTWNELQTGPVRFKSVCKLAVLVTVMSRAIDDVGWIEAVYDCLGEQSFTSMRNCTYFYQQNLFLPSLKIMFTLMITINKCGVKALTNLGRV